MEQDEAQIDIREFALKRRSKHEVYTKLTVNEGIYLPNEADVNIEKWELKFILFRGRGC